ncbi:MAG TPA: hypothetical protein VK440_04070 [Burkholderiales bacterium]|nr:hypothetical protein [Burkholderiales bacterium]
MQGTDLQRLFFVGRPVVPEAVVFWREFRARFAVNPIVVTKRFGRRLFSGLSANKMTGPSIIFSFSPRNLLIRL